ncbi:zinc dependent phospholipase C family protein [Ramlibacter sp. RBP-2]|uniref:Zinc dependent phospholipase C family protein n=1 Tax=Ramlibacter lithotrophicus TaxID=2606681 RepID=A0A7X6DK18_9BURK|nr:zinc dependent phospholipase C family protein [Ramlibacter lithotrophicus]NKE68624.1 zinc dependent phospholipase C family protein [Ramlibacter lithotrophicus]
MSGAYAHLAVVNDAQKHAEAAGLREDTLVALGLHLKFLELGSVSPDYPYLSLKRGQKQWADAMHYTHNSTLLRAGVAAVAALPEELKPKATVWLFGFAAHMTTDMTIHPVVELRVGPYQGNEGEHRRCEMHQDAFIFPRVMNVGETGLSEHLATGIATCHAPDDEDVLDPAVGRVWMAMLTAAYPSVRGDAPPLPDTWHCGFKDILSAMAGANHLFPFARHVSADLNLAYPTERAIDPSYIKGLRTPQGPMDYEAIFEKARSNVLTVWKRLDDALAAGGDSDELNALEDWNLDTGRTVQTAQLVFWRGHA